MKKAFRVIGTIIGMLILLGIGTSIGLGIGRSELGDDRALAEKEIASIKKKGNQLQARLTEQQNVEIQSNRFKVSLEEEKKSISSALEESGKERESLKENLAQVELRLKTASESLESLSRFEPRVAALSGEIEKLQGDLRLCEDTSMKAAKASAKEQEEKMAQALKERNDLEAKLNELRQGLEACRTDNAALCAIAGDLVEHYRNKGFFEALLQNEPLTQIKKVELEQFVERYRELIQKQELGKMQRKK